MCKLTISTKNLVELTINQPIKKFLKLPKSSENRFFSNVIADFLHETRDYAFGKKAMTTSCISIALKVTKQQILTILVARKLQSPRKI